MHGESVTMEGVAPSQNCFPGRRSEKKGQNVRQHHRKTFSRPKRANRGAKRAPNMRHAGLNSAMQNGASIKKSCGRQDSNRGARDPRLAPLANWAKAVSRKECTPKSIY